MAPAASASSVSATAPRPHTAFPSTQFTYTHHSDHLLVHPPHSRSIQRPSNILYVHPRDDDEFGRILLLGRDEEDGH